MHILPYFRMKTTFCLFHKQVYAMRVQCTVPLNMRALSVGGRSIRRSIDDDDPIEPTVMRSTIHHYIYPP